MLTEEVADKVRACAGDAVVKIKLGLSLSGLTQKDFAGIVHRDGGSVSQYLRWKKFPGSDVIALAHEWSRGAVGMPEWALAAHEIKRRAERAAAPQTTEV